MEAKHQSVDLLPLKAPRLPAHVLTPSQKKAVQAAIEKNRDLAGPVIPILHAVQAALGFVPEGAVTLIAEGVNQSRAEVHGVLTFYHYFRTEPVGKHVIYLCRAEACQAMGARELEAHAKRKLGVDFHETTTDGRFTLEPVYCLGNCACSPSLLIDDQLHGRVDAERFDALLVETAEAQP